MAIEGGVGRRCPARFALAATGWGAKNRAFFRMQTQNLPLDLIDIHGGTQTRVKTNGEAIESYAEEMNHGTVFPPITLFYDGSTYWLADGFHRYLAAKRIGLPTIHAEVRAGGRIDALKHALGANATNGVYRTNADKRNAAAIALEEWSGFANTVLAEICRVSPELVRSCRKELEQAGKIEKPERVTGRDGKEYPAEQKMEQEPRGKEEARSSDGEGGGGGRPSTKGDGGAPGGTNAELEREARAMIRRGEMNPFELKNMMSATSHDYASVVVNLLNTMRADDPKRNDGLLRIKRWIERVLSGEIQIGVEQAWSGETTSEGRAGGSAGHARANADDADDDDGDDADAGDDADDDDAATGRDHRDASEDDDSDDEE